MNTPEYLGERFVAAFKEAFRIHQLDLRKGTAIPYISHLMAVTALVLESGGDEDEAIAALLHDAAEDHGGEARPSVIADRFGERVAVLVRDSAIRSANRRRTGGFARSATSPTCGGRAILRISRADKLHNARAILRDYLFEGDRLWGRFNVGRADEQLWYYGELAAVFTQKLPGILSDELAEIIATLRKKTAS